MEGVPRVVGGCFQERLLTVLIVDRLPAVTRGAVNRAARIEELAAGATSEAGKGQAAGATPEAGKGQAAGDTPEAGKGQAAGATPEAGKGQAGGVTLETGEPVADVGGPVDEVKITEVLKDVGGQAKSGAVDAVVGQAGLGRETDTA